MPSIALNASDLQRVAFGNEAPQGAIPFAVALEILASDSMYTCGASLIGKQTIISAAHCFFDERGNLLALKAQAVVGERSISRPQRLYKVTGLVRPKDFAPAYTNQLYGDIVIAKLERTPSTGKVVALASSNTKVPKWLVTAGWGLTEDNRRTSNVLKYAAVPSLSLTQVKAWGQYSGTYYTMERDHVAAGLGSDRADSCQGDSGGPLFIPGSGFTNSESKNDLLYGVVSYGLSSQCGTRQNMNIGFYTSIPYWRSWILKEMKKKKWR
jgi:secreted trypsin-like serine protease